jgi:hypothetical protein
MELSLILAISVSAIIIILRIPAVFVLARLSIIVQPGFQGALPLLILVHLLPILPCAGSITLAGTGDMEHALISHTMTLGLLIFSEWVSNYGCTLLAPAYHNRSLA